LDTLFFDITNEDRPLPDCDLLVCADVLYTPKLAGKERYHNAIKCRVRMVA